jgi:signal transduction histidine kinase
MKSINTKMIWIILISVFITALIITSFFIYFSKKALRAEALEKLNSEAENIEIIIESGDNIDAIRKSLDLRQLLMGNPMLSSRMILIDSEKDYLPLDTNEDVIELNASIVDKISPELADMKKYISFDLEGRENIGIAYKVNIIARTIYFPGQIKVSWIYLYVPVDEIMLSQVVLRSFFTALSISMIISAGISIYFSRKLTKPLKQLSQYSKWISERKFSDIRKINTGDEFEELSVEFLKMADKLKLYDEKQKEFFQNASHNLKTPLMSIRGYAEAIIDNVAADKEKALGIIIDETDRLADLVKKILFISKSESVEEFYKFEELDVEDVISDVFRKFHTITDENGTSLNLEMDESLYVLADKEKLINALMNVVSNCVRYARSTINIRAYGNDENVVIAIEDDGEGFDPGEEELVFERFYKGEKGNYGLGLAITKMIIERHEGTIRAYNGNKGACIDITLKRIKNVPI